MSFRYKIALSIFLLEGFVMLSVLWQSLGYLESRLIEQIDLSNKMFISQLREYAVKEAVLTEDFADLQYQLENIKPDSGIEEIVVIDNQGVILASTLTERLGKNFDDMTEQNSWQVDQIVGSSGILGRLGYRIDPQHRGATAGALRFGVGLALTGMFVIAAVGILIGTFLTRRLEKIANSLSSIREGVVESIDIDESNDEVGQLSRFIRDMGQSVSSKMNKLVDIEEHTRFALQSAGAGAWRWDVINKSLYWSAKNFQLLGYLPNKNKPSMRLWRSMIHPEDAQRVDFAINALMVEHKDLDVEYRIVRRSGEVRWMRSVGRMYFDSNKEPTEVYGLQIDITQYKGVESTLADQVDLLKKMLNFCGDCLLTIGSKNEILLNNSATLYLFGYSRGELFGRPIAHLILAEDRQKIESLFDSDLHSSDQLAGAVINVTGLTKCGDTMPLQIKFQRYMDDNNYQRVTLLIKSLLVDNPLGEGLEPEQPL